MADAKLNVQIGADVTRLSTGIATAEKQLKSFERQANSSALKVSSSLNVASNATKGFTYSNEALRKSSLLAYTQSTKVINVNEDLAEAAAAAAKAQRLQATSSAEAAIGLKSLETGLRSTFLGLRNIALFLPGIGIAGLLGLAIEPVISFVSALDLFTKKVSDAAKARQQLADAQLKGSQDAQKELTTLKLLYTQTQNVSLSQEKRLEAVNALQEQYPKYFGNLRDEDILAGRAAKAYNGLANAILLTAQVRAKQDKIAENASQQLVLEQKIIDLKTERIRLEKELAATPSTGNTDIASGGSLANAAKAATLENKITNNRKEALELGKEYNTIQGQSLQLINSINSSVKLGAKLTDDFGDSIEKVKDIVTERPDAIPFVGSLGVKQAEQPLDSFGKKIENTSIITGVAVDKISEDLLRLQNDVLSSGIAEGISGIANSIGTALASGANVVEAFGVSVLSTIGDVLIQFGKLTLAAGIAATALGKALRNPLNPANAFAAIAAGGALIAIGALVKGFSSRIGGGSDDGSGSNGTRKIPGFANGVQNFRGGTALVGERGPELVNLPTGSNVIPNHDLKGFGGGMPNFIIRNEFDVFGQLITTIKREENRLRRLGTQYG